MRVRFVLTVVAMIVASVAAQADTISTFTTNNGVVAGGFFGQAFTVSGTGSFTDIAFSFLKNGEAVPASGTGYIFASEYSGTPAGLGSSDYLASGTASGDAYDFGSSVTLVAGQTYYFYEFYESGGLPGLVFNGDEAPGIGPFLASPLAGGSDIPFTTHLNQSADYLVTGSAAAASVTPEPSGFLLLGTGLLGVAGVIKKRLA